ncbi:MAG: hypothetical protein KAS72_04730 [Phycisphaerales bacterium]|nr:hypothetical protein [Phycisphaerales bacterium]
MSRRSSSIASSAAPSSCVRKGRALTLIEVIAAAALLSLLAAVTVPLLRDVRTALTTQQPVTDLFELARLADAVVADPESYGIQLTGQSRADASEQSVFWPGAPEQRRVGVRYLTSIGADHVWVAFQCGDRAVYRCIPVERDDEEATQ